MCAVDFTAWIVHGCSRHKNQQKVHRFFFACTYYYCVRQMTSRENTPSLCSLGARRTVSARSSPSALVRYHSHNTVMK